MRLAQTGRWTGRSRPATFDVTPDSWWGTRDRSWGVRPVGEPEPAGIRTEGQMQGFWNYAPMQFEDHSILYMVNEHDDGTRVIEEAIRIWNDPDRPTEHLGRPEHDAVITPGTRHIERRRCASRMRRGGAFEIRDEPLLDAG